MSIVPSSPSDRQKLKNLLVEVTNCLARIDGEKEAMKEIISTGEENFGVKKKIITKLARTMYKRNYSDLQAENDDFESLYEILVEGKISNSQSDDE